MDENILNYNPDKKCCRLNCKIYIKKLFKTDKEKENFISKKQIFLNSLTKSCKSCDDIKTYFTISNCHIKYKSEELIPERIDGRIPLLLVFGNPAIHSIVLGMFFSSEANGKRDHRFWKILDTAGIFPSTTLKEFSVKQKNRKRKEQILKSDYDSPFQIGLSVFHSMPSSASGEWAGVKGIHKLLGIHALRRLEQEEKTRALETIEEFVKPKGAVIVFQKNAWETLKSTGDPTYHRTTVHKEGLVGKVDGKGIDLICVPPTRFSGLCSKTLKNRIKILMN